MKGTSTAVLRKFVKDGGLSGSKYPINTNPKIPVLLISDCPDVDKNNQVEVEISKAVAREKKLGEDAFISEIRAIVVRKMKEGPHIWARHQHLNPGLVLATDSKREVTVTEGTDEKV